MRVNLDKVKEKKKNRIRNRLIFRSVIIAILLGAVIFALYNNFNSDKTIYKVGDEAPNFHLKQVNKHNEIEEVKLSDYRGKGVMLNFWATYCDPCKAEMPYMEQLYPEYKEKGIEIIAVSLDLTELVINRFIDKYDLTFAIPHDAKSQVTDLYKIGPMPTTFFIDPDGKIVEKVEGALTLERLEGYFKQILPE